MSTGMRLVIYQVDAFTDRVFSGNPAAVIPLSEWLPDELLQQIALENNLSETAFFVPESDGYRLRWFTPATEVDLCGHATLASAHVLFTRMRPSLDEVRFHSKSGPLMVHRDGERLVLDFPARPPSAVEPPRGLVEAVGGEPSETLRAERDHLLVYESEEEVRALRPDFSRLMQIDHFAIIATAPGKQHDFVSRFFAPRKGVPEDPVTGSAHCTLTPYWAKRSGKNRLRARQVSARGGDLECELRGDRVRMTGRAVLYLEGFVQV
jgi:predicted PhzF superfamily epimerase YddE/YHI9